MLWMGEEWGASTPWQFFTSHPEPELAAAVAAGRREEFAEHGWATDDVPDPQDPATFERSKLAWSELDDDKHADVLDFYRRLIALRRLPAGAVRPAAATWSRSRTTRAPTGWSCTAGRCGSRSTSAPSGRRSRWTGGRWACSLSSGPGFVYRDGGIELEPASAAVVEMTVRSS